MKKLIACASVMMGCTWLSTHAAQLEAADQIILNALPVACIIAEDADPTGATVVCALLDTAGNILQSVQTMFNSPAVAAAIVAEHPALPAVASKLKAASVKAVVTKKDGGK